MFVHLFLCEVLGTSNFLVWITLSCISCMEGAIWNKSWRNISSYFGLLPKIKGFISQIDAVLAPWAETLKPGLPLVVMHSFNWTTSSSCNISKWYRWQIINIPNVAAIQHDSSNNSAVVMEIGFRLHLRNNHQRLHPVLMCCCHLFSSVCLFPFVSASPCLYLSASPHLCCSLSSPTCFLVFSLACLSVISSISATPTQLLTSSITPQPCFSFAVCLCVCVRLCVRETRSQRKMEWDNVWLCFCCLLCFICFMGVSLFTLRCERVRKENRDDHVKCGFPPEGCLMDSECKIHFTSSLFTTSWHKLNTS